MSFLSNQIPQHSEAWVSLGEPTNHHGPKAKNSSKVAHSESAILQLTCKMELGGPVQSMVMYLLKAYYEPGYVSSFPPVENSQTLSLPSAEQLLVRNPELSTYYTIVQ